MCGHVVVCFVSVFWLVGLRLACPSTQSGSVGRSRVEARDRSYVSLSGFWWFLVYLSHIYLYIYINYKLHLHCDPNNAKNNGSVWSDRDIYLRVIEKSH